MFECALLQHTGAGKAFSKRRLKMEANAMHCHLHGL